MPRSAMIAPDTTNALNATLTRSIDVRKAAVTNIDNINAPRRMISMDALCGSVSTDTSCKQQNAKRSKDHFAIPYLASLNILEKDPVKKATETPKITMIL